MANITFNNADLSTYGLVTPRVSGVHDLVAQDRSRVWVPGRDIPNDAVTRRTLGTMRFGSVVVGSSHSDLIDHLVALKGLLSPALGFCTFVITDRSGLRTWARCLGFPVNMDVIPYLTDVVEFDLSFERFPYWEDASATVETNPNSITNAGQLPTFPTYTVTTHAVFAGGLHFEVGTKTFTYTGALADHDVLVIETDLPSVTKGGAAAMAGTSPTTDYPELVVGANTITKSSVDFALQVSYRERFE